MKYFLTSPDINEQKPPRLASSGPARIMTISVRLPGPGHWDMGLGTLRHRIRAANEPSAKFSQSRRPPLVEPFIFQTLC